jgi:Pheromone A receptor
MPRHCCVQLCVGFLWPSFVANRTLGLNIRLFWKSSQQLNGMLTPIRNPNQNRYIRLIALSSIQVVLALPLSLYILYFNSVISPIYPWISWTNTHLDYSRVAQYPSVIWRANPTGEAAMEINRWLVVLSAFLFFGFFGFAEEARKHYRLAYTFASSRLRLAGLSVSRASGSSARSLTSSFGSRFKKGTATFVGTPLGSHSWTGSMKERDAPSLVSDHRLTSDSSVFGDTDDEPKAIGFLPDDDDCCPAPAALTAVVVLPAIPRVPVPSLPVADRAVLSLPPDRLNSPLPHRPTSSYLEVCDNV